MIKMTLEEAICIARKSLHTSHRDYSSREQSQAYSKLAEFHQNVRGDIVLMNFSSTEES